MHSFYIIDSYLDSLCKLIRQLGATPLFVKEARSNVEMQIISYLAHWNDTEFRNALLVIGKEEGQYYKPNTPINPFVVVTIRNSLLENLNSVNYARTGLKKHIGPAEVKRITQQAIRHFATVSFDELSDLISISDDVDIYGGISAKYPLAWSALRQIGNSEDNIISYQPVVQYKEPIYADWASSEQNKNGITGKTKVTLDGYSKTIDPALQAYLFEIRDNERDCIYFDSFKMLTRNAEKLLYVINYILTYNGAFCTANYFITNGYIERRVSCLPPTSSDADFLASARKRQLLSGNIGKAHENALRSICGFGSV